MIRLLACLILLFGLSCRSTQQAGTQDLNAMHVSLSTGATDFGSVSLQVATARVVGDAIILDQVTISRPDGAVITASHGKLSGEGSEWRLDLTDARSGESDGSRWEVESMVVTFPRDPQ